MATPTPLEYSRHNDSKAGPSSLQHRLPTYLSMSGFLRAFYNPLAVLPWASEELAIPQQALHQVLAQLPGRLVHRILRSCHRSVHISQRGSPCHNRSTIPEPPPLPMSSQRNLPREMRPSSSLRTLPEPLECNDDCSIVDPLVEPKLSEAPMRLRGWPPGRL